MLPVIIICAKENRDGRLAQGATPFMFVAAISDSGRRGLRWIQAHRPAPQMIPEFVLRPSHIGDAWPPMACISGFRLSRDLEYVCGVDFSYEYMAKSDHVSCKTARAVATIRWMFDQFSSVIVGEIT